MSDEARSAEVSNEPFFETLEGDAARSLIGEDGQLRLLTLYHQRRDTAPFYLQVAMSLDRVNASVHALRRLFLITMPGGLLVAALASWLLASRALSRVGEIAEKARKLSASNLSDRIPQPRGRDEVATLVATINEMLDRLAGAFQAQEQFISNVSHELKTPLSLILTQAQVLMQRDRGAEEYERFLTGVQDEVRSLARTIDSLLILARADAGAPLASRSEVTINEAVMDAVQRCEHLAKQREVRLVPVLAMPRKDEPLPLVAGDGELIRLMITNLIRNAIRYSPVEETVEIEVALDEGQTFVSVRDRGPGIPEEYVEKVFDRFFQIPSRDGAFKGIGLGLTIVQGVARLHGGSVGVSNRDGGGSEFVVRLPLRKSQNPLQN